MSQLVGQAELPGFVKRALSVPGRPAVCDPIQAGPDALPPGITVIMFLPVSFQSLFNSSGTNSQIEKVIV